MPKRGVLSAAIRIAVTANVRNMGKDVYDVKKYAQFSQASFSWKYLEGEFLREKLKSLINPNSRMVEAGCGDGRLVKLMIESGAKPENIVGIDLSEYLLGLAKKETPEVRWILDSIAGNIDIGNGAFDLVTCSMVLNYLTTEELESFLKNADKWLKKGGTLLIVIPHPIRMVIESLGEYFDRKKRTNDAFWGEKVVYFHRTMSDYLNEIIGGGFVLNEIIEPELSAEGKKEDGVINQGKYGACPMRLAILAQKK
jgi:ubiquinone/menaquinone biosynthesis C-methylase UbiE